MAKQFCVFGLATWLITALASLGPHSRAHDVIARMAMPLEGGVIVLALASGQRRHLWILTLLITLCFVAVAATDSKE